MAEGITRRKASTAIGRTHDRTRREQELILRAWECAFPLGGSSYLSGPITTGPRFLRWYSEVGHRLKRSSRDYEAEHRRLVIEPNESEIIALARKLREGRSPFLLEPASLRIKDWTQPDYHTLWSQVVKRLAREVLLMDGWEYSLGCVIEFRCAIEKPIPVLKAHGEEVTMQDGLAAIRKAIREYDAVGVPSGALTEMVGSLESGIDYAR